MPQIPHDLQETFLRFTEGPTFLNNVTQDINPAVLNRPNRDGWSIRDIIVHLADAEIVGAYRFRIVLAEDEPTLPVYDQERWKKRLHYIWRSPEAALSLFQQTRFSTAEMLQQCDLASWQRTGIHPVRGRLTLGDLLRTYAEHVDMHIAQIEEMKG